MSSQTTQNAPEDLGDRESHIPELNKVYPWIHQEAALRRELPS